MLTPSPYSNLLQWHQAVELFDYDPAVDWAIELMRQGRETENVLILASFSKPVDREEIKPYVSAALEELGLEEKYGAHSAVANAHYCMEMILQRQQARLNLYKLSKLYLELEDDGIGLTPFYLLYHAWINLEEGEEDYYYGGATLENIGELLHREARTWIDTYIQGSAAPRTFAS